MALLDVFRGKRVLVTGHTGFKGAWLISWLNRLGAQVSGLSLEADTGSIFQRSELASTVRHTIGDMRSLEVVRRVVDEAAPDAVFHLAAQPLVRRSFADPIETVATNIMGTAHLLEALRLRRGACACLVVTSDKCYEPALRSHAHLETDPMGGHDPYSMSKGAAELVCASFRHSFFSPGGVASETVLATARAGNCIGGGDVSADRLVVDAVRAFSQKRAVELRNPGYVRPWQHVLDPVHGYLVLGAKLLSGSLEERRGFAEAFNFGPPADDAATVRKVIELMIEFSGTGSWADVSSQKNPPENPLLMLDTQKARARLPWRSVLGLRDAVKWTVDWYRDAEKASTAAAVRAVTDQQLDAFMERLAS